MEGGEREIGEGGVYTVNPAMSLTVTACEQRLIELIEVGKVGTPKLRIKMIVNARRI